MIIDVSQFQKGINWAAVKSQNFAPHDVKGVYIKATEGVGYIDPLFSNHVKGATGESFPIGFYHFATLNNKNVVADATAEALAFYEATKNIKVQLPYVLDIEKNELGLTHDEVLHYIQAFFAALRTKGITDIALYSYGPFLNSNLPVNHGLGNIKLWLAAYSLIAPPVPNGWTKYWLWQNSSKGVLNGVNGYIDISTLM